MIHKFSTRSLSFTFSTFYLHLSAAMIIENETHSSKIYSIAFIPYSFYFYFLSFKMPHKIGFVLTICRLFFSSSLFKLNISYKIRCVFYVYICLSKWWLISKSGILEHLNFVFEFPPWNIKERKKFYSVWYFGVFHHFPRVKST